MAKPQRKQIEINQKTNIVKRTNNNNSPKRKQNVVICSTG